MSHLSTHNAAKLQALENDITRLETEIKSIDDEYDLKIWLAQKSGNEIKAVELLEEQEEIMQNMRLNLEMKGGLLAFQKRRAQQVLKTKNKRVTRRSY
ncbi:hypothetical protein EJ08DRAFT_356985 [Tothia fuscella]|uniref:Uncharacterized protein n=1 Tax=Tothia fuscella TaxID=1048955 RepID=A0A9P4NM60_9PEZI|nr:hypothetical protein EJ08DRAFT_356985 [Tothia fuscella]